MSDPRIKSGTVTLTYYIYQYEEDSFYWRTSNGGESDMLFETAEDAEADIRGRYS